jgi:hypothetical protein
MDEFHSKWRQHLIDVLRWMEINNKICFFFPLIDYENKLEMEQPL